MITVIFMNLAAITPIKIALSPRKSGNHVTFLFIFIYLFILAMHFLNSLKHLKLVKKKILIDHH